MGTSPAIFFVPNIFASSIGTAGLESIIPDTMPSIEENVVLSMDAFEYGAGPKKYVHYMMGMREGYLIINSWNSREAWSWIKLPVSFDITALKGSTLGGANGQVAHPTGFPDTFSPRREDDLLTDSLWPHSWIISDLGTSAPVESLSHIAGSWVALSGERLFASGDDQGSWQEVTPEGNEVRDLISFGGLHYALIAEGSTIDLHSSDNGLDWQRLWQVDMRGVVRGEFMEIGPRLYIQVDGQDWTNSWNGILSTAEGMHWSDHGSSYWAKPPVGYDGYGDWNPLDLPADSRFFLSPTWRSDPEAGGKCLTGNGSIATLQSYQSGTWVPDPVDIEGLFIYIDWLGWYKVSSAATDVIDHIEFGRCWIKPLGERHYWFRSEHLGWIYICEDWMPWFWRLSDGHWYWVDLYNHRVWDEDDKAWGI